MLPTTTLARVADMAQSPMAAKLGKVAKPAQERANSGKMGSPEKVDHHKPSWASFCGVLRTARECVSIITHSAVVAITRHASSATNAVQSQAASSSVPTAVTGFGPTEHTFPQERARNKASLMCP